MSSSYVPYALPCSCASVRSPRDRRRAGRVVPTLRPLGPSCSSPRTRRPRTRSCPAHCPETGFSPRGNRSPHGSPAPLPRCI
ncbi:hypothetical protein STXM2123_283 [Streptomyces sp. F-3]|nr:hypothetical protein STXM2123_283 [Streptomyces sp. F-3]